MKGIARAFALCGLLATAAWLAAPKGSCVMAEEKAQAGVTKASFGKTDDGTEIDQYTLKNTKGSTAKVITYGATLTELWVAGKDGKPEDIVLGFDSLDGYLHEHPYFGATVGRYANRIAKGKFSLDGKEYTLAVNNGPNALHGGKVGFNRVVWTAQEITKPKAASVKFTYVSKDGEEGYPGTLTVHVTYELNDDNALKITYTAKTDAPTVLNLTNHSYFNLAGAGNGNVLKQLMWIDADRYTPTDDTLIPTGELKSVKGTPFDFRKTTEIGARISDIPVLNGYDVNYVINGIAGKMRKAAVASDPVSGRVMETWTTEPGVQLYIGIGLNGSIHGIGGAYPKYGAFCLETQHYPDSPNKPSFPTTVLKPGQEFHSETIYKFSVKP